MIEVIKSPGESKNVIVTIAIGDIYLKEWEGYAKPSWLAYCEKYDIGLLVVVDDLISKSHKLWKKATWQKLLLGDFISKSNLNINNACYLDTDILINPFAPNIFDFHDDNSISLVSLRFGIPYNYDTTLRKIAFYRNKYVSQQYPLDSALFISLKDLYLHHNLQPQNNEACMGLIVFNISKFSNIMSSWFYKYDSSVKTITNGGDQTHMNYEIQAHGKVKWLDYRFQALWTYEMANHYSFLYSGSEQLIAPCVRSSLSLNYFLHFPGMWTEGRMWKRSDIMTDKFYDEQKDFDKYCDMPVTGVPKGTLRLNL